MGPHGPQGNREPSSDLNLLPLSSTADTFEGDLNVSLILRDPPVLSMALVAHPDVDQAHRAEDPVIRMRGEHPTRWPTVVAADGDRILVQIPGGGNARLLVLTAYAGYASLYSLPPCDPSRPVAGPETGLISRGDEYAVAYMEPPHKSHPSIGFEDLVVVRVFHSTAGDWEPKTLPWPSRGELDDAFAWLFDSCLAMQDGLLWVDYRHDCLLQYDVFSDDATMHRIELPPMAPGTDLDAWKMRSMTVTAGDRVKLVHVQRMTDMTCEISVWLLDNYGYTWSREKLLSMNFGPEVPCFPILGGGDAQMLCLAVPHGQGVTHIYAVKLDGATLLGRHKYDGIVWNLGWNTPYLSSEIAGHIADTPVPHPVHHGPDAYQFVRLDPGASRTKAKID